MTLFFFLGKYLFGSPTLSAKGTNTEDESAFPQGSGKCLITQNSRQTQSPAKFSAEPEQRRDSAKVTPSILGGRLCTKGLAATHSWVRPTHHSDSPACITATVVERFLKDKRQYVSTAFYTTEPARKHPSVPWGPALPQIPGTCNKVP